MKYTPGPWKVRPLEKFVNGSSLQVWASDKQGHSWGNALCTVHDGMSDSTTNARLMSLAPELVEGLELALSLIEPADCGGGDCWEEYNQLKALVKRAKGEEPEPEVEKPEQLTFPREGLCLYCADHDNCPMPDMLSDPEEDIDSPDIEDGKVTWCPMFFPKEKNK